MFCVCTDGCTLTSSAGLRYLELFFCSLITVMCAMFGYMVSLQAGLY